MNSIEIYTKELLYVAERMKNKDKAYVEIDLIERKSDTLEAVRPFARFIGLNPGDKKMYCTGDMIDIDRRTDTDEPHFHEGDYEANYLTVKTDELLKVAKEANEEGLECVKLMFLDADETDGDDLPPCLNICGFDSDGDMEVGFDNIDDVPVPDDPRENVGN